jgi:hypothetical protein
MLTSDEVARRTHLGIPRQLVDSADESASVKLVTSGGGDTPLPSRGASAKMSKGRQGTEGDRDQRRFARSCWDLLRYVYHPIP